MDFDVTAESESPREVPYVFIGGDTQELVQRDHRWSLVAFIVAAFLSVISGTF